MKGQHLPNVVRVLLYDPERANLFQALCACAVKFCPSSRVDPAVFPNRELDHISTCNQPSHGSLHAYVTARLLFTCGETHATTCTDESVGLLSISVVAVSFSSPSGVVAPLLFAANPMQSAVSNLKTKCSKIVFE